MVGFFSRATKIPQKKKNVQKLKEIRHLVKEKKYDEALESGIEYLRQVPYNHDILFIVVAVLLLKAYSHQKLGENKRVIQCCEKIRGG